MQNRVIMGVMALVLGCGAESTEEEIAAFELAEEDTVLEIVENLRLAGYHDAEIEVRDDGVVFVEGDAEVSLEESREMIGLTASGEGDVDFRQHRTNDLVNTNHTLNGAPNAPSPLVRYSDYCYGSNTITWSYQPLATTYELYRATSAGFATSELIYSGNDTETSINVTSGTWNLRARACNNWGCSDWTNKASASRVNYCL